MRTVTKISQLTLAAALGLSLAACGSNSVSVSSSSTPAGSPSSSPASGASSAPSTDSSTSSASTGSDQAGAPDAKTLVHEARAAYRKAKSAHLHARIKQDTKVETIDIKGTVDGSNQDATISETGQGTAAFRTVANKTYIKADQRFWTTAGKLTKPVAAKVADKWVVAPASTKSQLSSITIKYFLDSVLGEDNLSDSELSKSTTKKSSDHGKEVYIVTDESPDGGSLTLAGDTKDFLRLLPPASQRDEGEVTADGWNQQPTVTAPAGALDPQSMK